MLLAAVLVLDSTQGADVSLRLRKLGPPGLCRSLSGFASLRACRQLKLLTFACGAMNITTRYGSSRIHADGQRGPATLVHTAMHTFGVKGMGIQKCTLLIIASTSSRTFDDVLWAE